MKKEQPRLGLISPERPTKPILLKTDPEVEKFLNDVSELSNHTVSSVVTVLLAVQCIRGDMVLDAIKPKPRKKKSTTK